MLELQYDACCVDFMFLIRPNAACQKALCQQSSITAGDKVIIIDWKLLLLCVTTRIRRS